MNKIVKIRVSQHPRERQAGTEYKSFAVTLPHDWAAEQIAAGFDHVHIARARHGTRELVITPIKAEDAQQVRQEMQREKRRAYARKRYQQQFVPPSERIVVTDTDREMLR